MAPLVPVAAALALQLAPVELTSVDAHAIGFATFQSYNQKVVSNAGGIFLTYLKERNEAYTQQRWRLCRSVDGGRSFTVVHESVDATNPPVLETDEHANVYLFRPDFESGDAWLYRFLAADDYARPRRTRLPGGGAGKFSAAYDRARGQLYYFAHDGTLHVVGLDGELRRTERLIAPGEQAVLQYPLLFPESDGELLAGWTTLGVDPPVYRAARAMRSNDGAVTWRDFGGAQLAPPVVADEGGGALCLTLDDELEAATWLSSLLARDGKAHFLYLAQTTPQRQHYVRLDLSTGALDRRVQPRFGGEQVALHGLGGFFTAGADGPLFCLGASGGQLGCVASDDCGDSWRDHARSEQAYNVYSIGGAREVTPDGFVIGTFTDLFGTTEDLTDGGQVWFFKLPVEAPVTPPAVPGFERVGGSRGGALLFGELGCAACHDDGAGTAPLDALPAADLSRAASRLQHDWLRRFLADPRAVEPGTRMPDVLARLPRARAEEAAVALTHFLVSLAPEPVRAVPIDRGAAARGERLWRTAGCLACHAPDAFEGFESKYAFDGLRELLDDPLGVRPSGRMPDLQLDGEEARELAQHLLRDAQAPGHVRYALYRGGMKELADLEQRTPVEGGVTERFGKHVTPLKNDYSLRFETWLVIERAGTYVFHVSAQDGARLAVGDTEVVAGRPGRQSAAEGVLEVDLDSGAYPLTLDYHQSWISGSLSLEWEGPGIARGEIPPARMRSQREPFIAPARIVPRPELVARGRELYGELGCVSCHPLDGLDANGPRGPAPGALDPARGCLSEDAFADYGLDEAQRAALGGWIAGGARRPDTVADRMAALDCYACHERGGVGGPDAAHAPRFTTTDPDPDDEARIPPRLDGVGAKLRPAWLARVLEEGTGVRPTMDARMPRFGAAQVAGLAEAFVAADREGTSERTLPPADDTAKELGRELVGRRAWNCVACHRFRGQDAASMQRVDLTGMSARLEPDWFVDYLPDASRWRPGTRMPALVPLASELDGDLDAQVRALWAYLADGADAPEPDGLHHAPNELAASDGRALVYRGKLEQAGFRAIAVAHPEGLNLAFDAEEARMAFFWKGRFLDVGRHWSGSGMGAIGTLGEERLELPAGAAFARLADASAPWPQEPPRELGLRFGGYVLDEADRPTFLYSLGDVQVEDRVRPVERDGRVVFQRELRLRASAGSAGLWFRAARAPAIELPSGGPARIGGDLELRVAGATVLVRRSEGERELLVPIELEDGAARLVLEYRW